MCRPTLHNFLSGKIKFFIRALLLDRILALEKTTRTPRVPLVIKAFTHTYINLYMVARRHFSLGGGGWGHVQKKGQKRLPTWKKVVKMPLYGEKA